MTILYVSVVEIDDGAVATAAVGRGEQAGGAPARRQQVAGRTRAAAAAWFVYIINLYLLIMS